MDQTAKAPTDDTSVFFIGEPGLVAMAVCVPAVMTHEQIAAEVNAKSPTGITSRWTVTEHADLNADDIPVGLEELQGVLEPIPLLGCEQLDSLFLQILEALLVVCAYLQPRRPCFPGRL